MDLLGKTLGNYRIDRLLGEGGMGAVYHAHDISLQREVAIKLVHPHLARQPGFRERFIHEARIMAHLDHPGIVRVYHLGVEKELLYLPMEFIKGGNLRQLLDRLIQEKNGSHCKRHCCSSSNCARRWNTPTKRESCTAISNPST